MTATRTRTASNGTGGVRQPPPHDIDAEEALIGAMLLPGESGRSAVETAMAAVVPADFYKPAHGHIVAAIYSLAAMGSTIDPVTVVARLRHEGVLDACGGDATATDLIAMMGDVPHTAGAASWASIVAGTSRRRHMRSVAAAIDDAAQVGDDDALVRALETARAVAGAGAELVAEDLGAVIRGEEPAVVPTLLCRTDGRALLYPGLLHWVIGEPGCGKTWLALVAALAAVRRDVPVLYLDYEGSRRIVGARLAALGATEADVGRISYVRPPGTSGATGAGAVRLVRERGAGLVVLDGAAKAIARDGLDEDRASDVLGWLERMVWPLCEAGAAVVILDHVPKDKDARGRWARGSGAKLGEVDGAAYSVEVAKDGAWSRSKAGEAWVKVAKDREGVVGAVGDVAAILRFVPDAGGLRAWLDVPPGVTVTTTAGAAVELVVNELDGVEVSQARLEKLVREHGQWRNDVIRSAAESLAASGRIRVRTGQRNARLYSSLSPAAEDAG